MNHLCREHARNQSPMGTDPFSQERRVGPYVIREDIAEGTTGNVKLAYNTSTGTYAAVKVVNKTVARKRREAKNEIKFLKTLEHENIIRLEHVEEDNQYIYIFTEYCPGGDVYTFIEKNGKLNEDLARNLFRQMVDAVEYCHRNGTCHHDIKLENCVIDHEMNLKLIDFGFSVELDPELAMDRRTQQITTFDGSPAYSALEVLQRRPHDESIDIYGLGTCLYYMLVGTFPFCDSEKTTFEGLCKNVQENIVEFPIGVSTTAQDIVVRMLGHFGNRITIPEIQEHEWMF